MSSAKRWLGCLGIRYDSDLLHSWASVHGRNLYLTRAGDVVTTELGPPPEDDVDFIAQLVRNTLDGQPWIRPLRRLLRTILNSPNVAILEIPATKEYDGSAWLCTMSGDVVTFVKQSETKPISNAA